VNTATIQSAGLLVLRLVVGTTFLVHGVDKLGDLSAAEQFFAAQSIPAPGLMAPLVGATETVGGLALILGLATPLVAAALTALAGPGRYSVDAVSRLSRLNPGLLRATRDLT
jgi:uncharacterized membrane protein YphA (DoxX/SURF4 family)